MVQREVELQRAPPDRGAHWGGLVTQGCNESDEKCKEKATKTVDVNHHAGLKHQSNVQKAAFVVSEERTILHVLYFFLALFKAG